MTKPTLREQITAALPDHACIQAAGVIGWAAGWTTPASAWYLDVQPFSTTATINGHGVRIELRGNRLTADIVLAQLRLLGAIEPAPPAECATCHGAHIVAAPGDPDHVTICPNPACRTGVYTEEYQELWADMEAALRYLHTHCRGSQTAEDLLGKFGWLDAAEAIAAGHIPHEGEEIAPTVLVAGVVPMPTLTPDAEARQHIAAALGHPCPAVDCDFTATTDDALTVHLKFHEQPEKADWMIWSNHHNAWWRANSKGYTSDPRAAGRYTATEAAELSTRRSWTADMAVPPEVAVQIPAGLLLGDPNTDQIFAALVETETLRRVEADPRCDCEETGSNCPQHSPQAARAERADTAQEARA